MVELQEYVDTAVQMVMHYAPKLVLAVIVLLIGLRLISWALRLMEKAMDRAETDQSLQKFLVSFASVLLKILLFISIASMVGIATTSFVAILGAAGLAVGLALQGSLGNLAGGVLILIFKPFRVGDFIEAQGYIGKVNSIQILNTILKTPDNKTVIIPNGQLSSGVVTNFSSEETRRVDMTFGIGYDDDIPKAKDILKRLVSADERILKDPEPMVVVSALADSSVNFAVRAWVKTSDYWGVFFDMHEKVKLTFDEEGVSIPFPQRDVHLFQEK